MTLTYNNCISALRRAFAFGYLDYPDQRHPAASLRCARVGKKGRPQIDPFSIQDAEFLITALHADWGEARGNYDEFRFFTGLRHSEEMALHVRHCDLEKGTIHIKDVIVLGRDKDRPKNDMERTVELNPRALAVLKRQLPLRDRHVADGTIARDFVFFTESGLPLRSSKYTSGRWLHTIEKLSIRYRKPYAARHSCVIWHLLIGKDKLWCSKNFGHGVEVMFKMYAAWIDGSTEADIACIRRAMEVDPTGARVEALMAPCGTPAAPEFRTSSALEGGWGKLSWRKCKYFTNLTGGADGTFQSPASY